jgi:hypothetical protein
MAGIDRTGVFHLRFTGKLKQKLCLPKQLPAKLRGNQYSSTAAGAGKEQHIASPRISLWLI